MPPVPSRRGERIVRALERAGFKVARTRGSHHIMRHPNGRGTTVPVHPGHDVSKGTLSGILADVGMTAEELQWLLLLSGPRTRKLPDTLSRLGIAGGAVYDALVALAAQEHEVPLATRDARAQGTYEAVGVKVVVVT